MRTPNPRVENLVLILGPLAVLVVGLARLAGAA